MSFELLSTLLDQEYFLTKVFGYLLEDGLHECRLVCRKWRDVCRRMPVKLVGVPVKKLPVVVNRFPNAVALSFQYGVKWSNEDREAIQSLARLRAQLKSLEVTYVYEDFDDLRIQDIVSFCNSLGGALRSCRQLQSLSFSPLFNVPPFRAEAGICFYSHISHLTGLTRLHFTHGWERLVNDPRTEIRNIEDLAIRSVCLENKRLVFPSLTHLTRLRMSLDGKPAEKFKGGALQMILPYAPSLQSLEIRDPYRWLIAKAQWPFFGEFRQLSSLDFVHVLFDVAQDYCAALNCLNLTHLGFKTCRFSVDFEEKMVKVRSLTSLRSLGFQSFSHSIHKMFAAVPQLTSLRMWSLHIIEPLTVLTALRHLEFTPETEALSNLSHALSCLSNLETLSMTDGDHDGLPSSCFSHLKDLRSLSLEEFTLDEDIFHVLAQLSELTELCLSNCFVHPHSMSSGINALTNLKSLKLDGFECPSDAVSVLMEGKLSRLRYLSLTCARSDVSKLRPITGQRFPCLRQYSIRESAYGKILNPFES